MKAVVVFHGDCDGVIAAGLYIRRFLRDYYPEHIVLRFTQPWRVVYDTESALRSVDKQGVSELVILDLAMSNDLIGLLKKLVNENSISITVVDHHASSMKMIDILKQFDRVRVYWDSVQSTPQVLAKILRNLNKYESFLVDVANVCEGGEARDQEVQQVADKIKLVLALDPTDSAMFYNTVKSVVEGIEFWQSEEFEKRFYRAKWLLNMLIKAIERRAKDICGWKIASFSTAESLVYAGLFGIAASEFMKKHRSPLALVRSEGKKVVVTIRSSEGRALDLCQAISKRVGETFYGGHKEAASLTIYGDHDLGWVEKVIEDSIRELMCR